jgi:phosphate-selective porin
MNTKLQMKTLCRLIATAVILTASAQSMAGAVLTNSAGDLAIGVNDEGHLNTSDGNVAVNGGGSTGIAYDYGTGFQDATAPQLSHKKTN